MKNFLTRAKHLSEKLGPLLVQLPPSFKVDAKALESFLERIQTVRKELRLEDLPVAFEFRHVGWFEKSKYRNEAIDLLEKYNCAFVWAHSHEYPYPDDEPITADFLYLRFHGPGKLFASEYGEEGLKPWAKKIQKFLNDGYDVYAYFNNTDGEYAPKDAQRLYSMATKNKY